MTPDNVKDDSDDEEFVYPGVKSESPTEPTILSALDPTQVSLPPDIEATGPEPSASIHDPLLAPKVEEFIEVPEVVQHPTKRPPSPAQLEALQAAASSGDLRLLQNLFRSALEGDVEPFALANDASSRTGLTALHVAASRGYLEIVKFCT